jgi:hypothetical protein
MDYYGANRNTNTDQSPPFVLQNVQTDASVGVDIWVEHLREPCHCWWFAWILQRNVLIAQTHATAPRSRSNLLCKLQPQLHDVG